MILVLLCSVYRAFLLAGVFISLPFLGSPLFPPFLFYSFIHYLGSPLFFLFNQTGAGAGELFFCWVGLMAGLQVGQALRCSSYLGLGSAVPAPMSLGIQPPYVTKALIYFLIV